MAKTMFAPACTALGTMQQLSLRVCIVLMPSASCLFMAWQSAQMDMPNGGKGTSVRDHKKSLYVDILILKGIAMETDPSGINTCCSRGPLQQRMRQSNELQRGGLIPA